jgi:hypothetical protein|tara:strand:+ start:61 stop:795 length:735 start_codon:yes stop_codon:yes gene_type:complete
MADDEFTTAVADPAPETEVASQVPDVPAEPEAQTDQKTIESLRKQVNDLKSQNVGRLRADQRQTELKDEFAKLKRTMTMFIENQVNGGDLDVLEKELSDIQSEEAQQAVGHIYEESYDRATAMLQDVLHESGLDPSGPELAETRTVWNEAKAGKNSEGHFEAVALASKAASLAHRAKIAAGATAPIDGTTPSERANNMAMAVPAQGAGASVSDQELVNRYGRGEVERTNEVRAAAKRLGLDKFI